MARLGSFGSLSRGGSTVTDALNRLRENMRKTARALQSGDWGELTETQKEALMAIRAQNEQVIRELVKTVGPQYLRANEDGKELLKQMGLVNGWWDAFEQELAKNPPEPE
jgi:hypothetical protein